MNPEVAKVIRGDVVRVFVGADGRWYWHRVGGGGNVISTAGQGYRRKWNAMRSAKRVNRDLDSSRISYVDAR